jgi:hypothetical protein
MIRIAITERAYRAIKTSLPQDMALKPVERSTTGKTVVWLPSTTINQLSALRQPREELSDVIMRLARKEFMRRNQG